MNRQPKHILLIGAGGIASQLAPALAQIGFRSATIGWRNHHDSALAWQALGKQHGIEATIHQLDATDPIAVREFFIHMVEQSTTLDAVIYTGGDFSIKAPLSYSPEQFRDTFTSNLDAAYNIAQCAMPHLRASQGALLLCGVAHADQLHSQPNTMAYSMAKTALLVMMRTLARTEAVYNVRVNMISPGLMNSGTHEADPQQVPMKRAGTAHDFANAVRYLLSDEAHYVTGTNLILSGGWAI